MKIVDQVIEARGAILKGAASLTAATTVVAALFVGNEVRKAYNNNLTLANSLSRIDASVRHPSNLEAYPGTGIQQCVKADNWVQNCVIGEDNASKIDALPGVKPAYATLAECLKVHDENHEGTLRAIDRLKAHPSYSSPMFRLMRGFRTACSTNDFVNVSFERPGDFSSIQIHLGESFSPVMNGWHASRDPKDSVPLYGDAAGGLMRADGLNFDGESIYDVYRPTLTEKEIRNYSRSGTNSHFLFGQPSTQKP